MILRYDRRNVNERNQKTKQGVNKKIKSIPDIKSQFAQSQMIKQKYGCEANGKFYNIDE